MQPTKSSAETAGAAARPGTHTHARARFNGAWYGMPYVFASSFANWAIGSRQTISFRFPFPLKDSITKRVSYLSERPAPVANRPHSNSLMIEHLLLALALSSE